MKTIIDVTSSDNPIYINQDLSDLNKRKIYFNPELSKDEICELNIDYDTSIILTKQQLEELHNQLTDFFDITYEDQKYSK